MELSWSTFVLEIINFLVLVWILKRFLYKPVLNVIARRQAGIAERIKDAESLHAEAEKLQRQYEGRLVDWEKERKQARDTLAQEMESERQRKMTELQATLQQEQEKSRAIEARRERDAMHRIEEAALRQSARFASRLLEQACGPETQTRLVELFISELNKLPKERIATLRSNYDKTPADIEVTSAFPLSDTHQEQLRQTLQAITTSDSTIDFTEDRALLAGVHVTIGAWVLAANIRDELKGFVELT